MRNSLLAEEDLNALLLERTKFLANLRKPQFELLEFNLFHTVVVRAVLGKERLLLQLYVAYFAYVQYAAHRLANLFENHMVYVATEDLHGFGHFEVEEQLDLIRGQTSS